MGGTGGGIQVHTIVIPACVWAVPQGPGSNSTVGGGLRCHGKPGHMTISCRGAGRAETDLSQVVFAMAVKHSEQDGEQEPRAQVITPGACGWSNHHAMGTGSGDRVGEGCASMLQPFLGWKHR